MGHKTTTREERAVGTDVAGKEKRGAAPEPAEWAELRLDEGFELTDETLGAIVGGGGGGGYDGTVPCVHKCVFVRKEEGKTWGYIRIYRCAKCGEEEVVWA